MRKNKKVTKIILKYVIIKKLINYNNFKFMKVNIKEQKKVKLMIKIKLISCKKVQKLYLKVLIMI